jgi:hypothetical protein
LEAGYAVIKLVGCDEDGSLMWRAFATHSTVVLLGKFAVAAAVCAVAGGLWKSETGRSWMLVLNGAALGAYGLTCVYLTKAKISFLPFALLFVVMAMSNGVFGLRAAPALRRRAFDKWFVRLAAALSVGFAFGFLALGFRWVRLEEPTSYYFWMTAYFAFSAAFMLVLGLRLNGLRTAIHRMAAA